MSMSKLLLRHLSWHQFELTSRIPADKKDVKLAIHYKKAKILLIGMLPHKGRFLTAYYSLDFTELNHRNSENSHLLNPATHFFASR